MIMQEIKKVHISDNMKYLIFTIFIVISMLSIYASSSLLNQKTRVLLSPSQIVMNQGYIDNYTVISPIDYNTLYAYDKETLKVYSITVSGDSWDSMSVFEHILYRNNDIKYITIDYCNEFEDTLYCGGVAL